MALSKDRENWILEVEIDRIMVIQSHSRRLIPLDEFIKEEKENLLNKKETPKEGENICHGFNQDDKKIN